MGTNSQDASRQWPNESTSAGLRYYPVHQTQADLEFESTRLFASDDSGRDTEEIAAVEACKVDGDGSMFFPNWYSFSAGALKMYANSQFSHTGVVVDNKIGTHARLDQFL